MLNGFRDIEYKFKDTYIYMYGAYSVIRIPLSIKLGKLNYIFTQ